MEFCDGSNTDKISRRDRLRIQAVKTVVAGLVERQEPIVYTQPDVGFGFADMPDPPEMLFIGLDHVEQRMGFNEAGDWVSE